jgi:hypothetical protein
LILSGTKIPKENLVPNKLIDIRRGNAYAFPGSHLQRSPFVKEKLLLSPINRKLVIIFMVVLIFVGKQFSLAGESEDLAFIKTVSGTSLTFGNKNICFLILEGSETNPISAEMILILERNGAKLRTRRLN